MLVTTADRAKAAVEKLLNDGYVAVANLVGICVIDKDMADSFISDIPVFANKDNILDYACKNLVDEVLFDRNEYYVRPDIKLQEGVLEMGITTHTKIYETENERNWQRTAERYGPYTVLTRSIKLITRREQIVKSLLDFFTSLVGSLVAIIIIIIIGPIIYIQSPGPILFKQERVGMNGRRFKMYKLRSMVINADEMKAQLLDQNRVSDGMMFKLDWDSKVIGNKILPDGTRKTGIGEFIRKTSLDEFPQFFNVLLGEHSIFVTTTVNCTKGCFA